MLSDAYALANQLNFGSHDNFSPDRGQALSEPMLK